MLRALRLRGYEMICKITISPDAVARRVGDETVILHLGSGTYFGLDSVGARIWQLLGEGKSLNEICEVALDEYDVSREDLERDIAGLINDLVAQDLVSTS
jgi:coenzyme PQQ synthesis protein D (PqqD)